MSALADRRQRAREAYYDRYSLGDNIGGSARKAAIRECIETATRVRIDGQLMAYVFPLVEGKLGLRDAEQIIAAAFRAAGFEVEEMSALDDRRHADEEVPIVVSAFEILPDGVEVPIGKPYETTISLGALDLLHGNVSPLDDRRQRAREAAHDAATTAAPMYELLAAVDAAVETATRVQITREVEAAVRGAFEDHYGGSVRPIIAAALTALGFEVKE